MLAFLQAAKPATPPNSEPAKSPSASKTSKRGTCPPLLCWNPLASGNLLASTAANLASGLE